ncbi:uncharacterized protein I206_107579 [Kwoniella pini CBS 10737]|uniref:C2H2-type domain-containing protein n=1 Tax=Kwoniella pini CBS 10737 TaxID=1296096 RepID=A0A1B9HXP0_9TREE|nr:uncharacterized protein I206_05912 [Kwoniella pini CBS 10737]OCF48045.1 hypothetical protein I206_05912 [Kwoniella pini CBS 10737]
MVAAKSPPNKSSPIPLKAKSPKSPRSPRSPRSSKPSENFAPLSSLLTDEPISTDPLTPVSNPNIQKSISPAPRGLALRRVLSGDSNTATPSTGSVPLSPSSGGIRTPRAKKQDLGEYDMEIDPKLQTSFGNGENQNQLANHLDGLQVNSPINGATSSSALGITQALGEQTQTIIPQSMPVSNQASSSYATTSNIAAIPINGQNNTHYRSYSTSTEGSTSSLHPHIPSNLGSSYGPDGFPVYSRSPEGSPNIFNSSQQSANGNGYHASLNVGFGGADANGQGIDPELAAKQAEALAKADEAVKALNGTASLYQSGAPMFEPYNLQSSRTQFLPNSTGGGANFVTPQQPNVVRQSSTSSSTTDAASTSSEESDWCIPTIEWVSTNPQSPRFVGNGYPNSPGVGSLINSNRDRSSNKMPPPSSINRPISPKVQDRPSTLQHQQSLPIGASAATPSGINQSSALPLSIHPDGAAEDDDEEITVGHNGRDRSPSTSSQSAQSGLDLLWRATHMQSQPKPKAHLPVQENAASFDHKGKRKAGAEAVDKWRSSGIPTGVPLTPTLPQSASVPINLAEAHGNGTGTGHPPKKRRRSELALESMEPPDSATSSKREYFDEEAILEDESKSPSASSEPPSDADDSEYGAVNTHKRGRPSNRGRVMAGTKRAIANAKASGKANINPANAPGGVTKGGTIKKVRKVGDSPPGGNRGRRSSGSAAGGEKIPAGGVQCDYNNPLFPYNRCTDVFTRKYDLPRHMARHARREGELVLDGKLPEDKALLWKTIKDKPKVTCNDCGENFTRMDALKRHQAKQHRH